MDFEVFRGLWLFITFVLVPILVYVLTREPKIHKRENIVPRYRVLCLYPSYETAYRAIVEYHSKHGGQIYKSKMTVTSPKNGIIYFMNTESHERLRGARFDKIFLFDINDEEFINSVILPMTYGTGAKIIKVESE